MIVINTKECVVCGGCIDLCPKAAIRMINDLVSVDPQRCSECMICVQVCPVGAPFADDQGDRTA